MICKCGFEFDDSLGKYGCPDCEGSAYDELTAKEEAKAAGLKSLAHMAELTGEPAEKLRRWHRDRPRLFSIVLFGCQKVLEGQRADEIVKALNEYKGNEQ